MGFRCKLFYRKIPAQNRRSSETGKGVDGGAGQMTEFSPSDYWKGIILYGLTLQHTKWLWQSAYFKFARAGQNRVLWEELATSFYDEYRHRITINPTPQMAIPGRLTVLERIVKEEALGIINRNSSNREGRSQRL